MRGWQVDLRGENMVSLDDYFKIFANFYNRSYLIDFINKNENKIVKTVGVANDNIDILSLVKDYSYAQFFDFLYDLMKNNYRCEYVYLNEIFVNEILKNHDEGHSILTELCVNRSQADLVVVNGTTTVYEIKTELDSLTRLGKQLEDYIQVFDKVFVITYRDMLDKLIQLLDGNGKYLKVGIFVLNEEGKLNLIREGGSHKECLNKELMFNILHRREFEYFDTDYDLAKENFLNLSIYDAHEYFKQCLVLRCKDYKYVSNLPISLKLAGFKIQNSLNRKQKEKFYTKLNRIVKEDFICTSHIL